MRGDCFPRYLIALPIRFWKSWTKRALCPLIVGKPPLVHLVVTSPATAPSAPASPNAVLNIAVALVVGVLVGLSAAVLREVLDNRIKSEERLAETAAGVA